MCFIGYAQSVDTSVPKSGMDPEIYLSASSCLYLLIAAVLLMAVIMISIYYGKAQVFELAVLRLYALWTVFAVGPWTLLQLAATSVHVIADFPTVLMSLSGVSLCALCVFGACRTARQQRIHEAPSQPVPAAEPPVNETPPPPKPRRARPTRPVMEAPRVADPVAPPPEVRTVRERPAPKCPKCDKVMIFKKARLGGFFWGCKGYPNCRGTRPPTHSE